jgi:hypothetical protein
VASGVVGISSLAQAFCGCDKPPPARAAIRPAFGYPDQLVTLFDERLEPGTRYRVVFTSADGNSDWSAGRASRRPDMADGRARRQLRVTVPDVPLGPASAAVYTADGILLYEVAAENFTVIAPPIVLSDRAETFTQDGYRTGVAADGTIYIALDLSQMSNATVYTGKAEGFDLRFDGSGIAIFNSQGVLGEILDTDSRGLFKLLPKQTGSSTEMAYWRHEFRTYKDQHRKRDERMTSDGEWHADGSRHVDNEHLVLAIAGTLPNGHLPAPGATPPFRLLVTSTPAAANPLR